MSGEDRPRAESGMTAAMLAERLGAKVHNMPHGGETVTCGYAGDILSRVMTHAERGCAWVTAANGANAAAVAEMTGAACIVLAEGVQPDGELLEAAVAHGLNLLSCAGGAFELCSLIAAALDARTAEPV